LRFCKNCRKEAHEDFTCEEYSKRIEDANEDKEFGKYLEEQGYKRCPSCGVPCLLARGCKFMTCISVKCNKETYFCYLCGR